MTTTLLIIIGLLIFGGAGVFALVRFGLRASSGGASSDVQLRLEEYGGRTDISGPLTLEEIEMSQPFSKRVVQPILVRLADAFSRLSPSKSRAAAELQLELAGRPNNWGAREFFGIRIFVALVLAAFLFLLTTLGLGGDIVTSAAMGALVGLLGALIGFMLPILWLRTRTRNRQYEIVRSLPDALDLLTIAVEAGMGFDQAMHKIADKWDNELSKGFNKVVQEMRLGIPRRDALKNMDKSMGVPDVTTFVAAIIQAEQLGVSMAKILRVQSEQMRIKRRQRAQELANKAPIKMLFPMVFLIFPALFIILLGPAVLILMETNFG